jgi:uncharacterized protein (TIGR03435 family)
MRDVSGARQSCVQLLLGGFITLTLVGGHLNGQSTFDAASVRVSDPIADLRLANCKGGPGTADPGLFTCNNMSLKNFVGIAYNVAYAQISGPDWLGTGQFDIRATVPAGSTREQFRIMLQNLLAERFHLKQRRGSAAVDGFALIVSKSGLRVKRSNDQDATKPLRPSGFGAGATAVAGCFSTTQESGRVFVTARQQTLASFARYLSGLLKQPVEDETAVSGEFNFVFDFADWYIKSNVANGETASSIVTEALEETLGLSLKARKTTVDTLVVESADKVPVPN